MNTDPFRELEDIPFSLPTSEEFGVALIWIKAPLESFEKAVSTLMWDAGTKGDESLLAIGNMITVFLGQLDYLVKHAQINGKSIAGAEIHHPFEVTPKTTISKEEITSDAENA